MPEQEITGNKLPHCNKHRLEISTHICTHLHCPNNPILCRVCYLEQIPKHYHFDHESSILPFNEGINTLSSKVKTQRIKIGDIINNSKGNNLSLVQPLPPKHEKFVEMERKMAEVKSKVERESESLVKEVQKIIESAKQELFVSLAAFEKSYKKNIEVLYSEIENINEFNTLFKNYSNENIFYLKVLRESSKKNNWISKLKKNLEINHKKLELKGWTEGIVTLINNSAKFKTDVYPVWKFNEGLSSDFQSTIKKYFKSCVEIPEIITLTHPELEIPSRRFSFSPTKHYYSNINS